jgi:hypothetical protein
VQPFQIAAHRVEVKGRLAGHRPLGEADEGLQEPLFLRRSTRLPIGPESAQPPPWNPRDGHR